MRRGARRAVEAALALAVVATGAACAGGSTRPTSSTWSRSRAG
ncbi:hypothetical protein [Phycicoccus sp. Soil748]|nr:hypothetical protein [Phycicoccus sp. Soil748]